jgi:hypothetical protein
MKINKKNIEDIFALTPMQEGMLFHFLKDIESDQYFEQLTLDISGDIKIELFEKAWNFVIETNEMLRAVFRWENVENPVQIILKKHNLQPLYYDLSGKENKGKRFEEIKIEDRAKKFDLREVPFRVTLCKLVEKKYKMVISNHHILYDGWSNGIILKEFFGAYDELCKGNIPLFKTKPKFVEYVKWVTDQDKNKQKDFWKKILKDFNSVQPYPFESKKRKSIMSIESIGNYRFQFPTDIKERLDEFVKRHNTTIAALLYSSWGILLLELHAINDVLFDTTIARRSTKTKIQGIGEVVGLFIDTLPLRVQTHTNDKITDLLSQVLGILQEWQEFERSSPPIVQYYYDKYWRKTLFDSVVVVENYPLDRILVQQSGLLTINSFEICEMTQYYRFQ